MFKNRVESYFESRGYRLEFSKWNDNGGQAELNYGKASVTSAPGSGELDFQKLVDMTRIASIAQYYLFPTTDIKDERVDVILLSVKTIRTLKKIVLDERENVKACYWFLQGEEAVIKYEKKLRDAQAHMRSFESLMSVLNSGKQNKKVWKNKEHVKIFKTMRQKVHELTRYKPEHIAETVNMRALKDASWSMY